MAYLERPNPLHGSLIRFHVCLSRFHQPLPEEDVDVLGVVWTQNKVAISHTAWHTTIVIHMRTLGV